MYKTIVISVCWFRCRFRCQDVHAQISKCSFSWILSVLYWKTGIYCRDENTLWFFTLLTFRSGHRRCFVRKVVLRNFAKFTGKHLCQSFFFSKVAGLRLTTLLKKRLCLKCFSANFKKFIRTPFSQNASGRLPLDFVSNYNKTNLTWHLHVQIRQ